ncbi:glutamate synthase large subunit [Coralloluteibacterium thermophilus]|uniref:Glutamate synthase large subunit n=1 Tax=Coralloluteibacterium thermophilum TaxID=2707049 RepID=A0ABV9NIZ6_9GAMM
MAPSLAPGPGLYSPAFEHDSCGFGLIAHTRGGASREVVAAALQALARLAHRGALSADGITGDGAGILIHRPEGFLRAVAAEAGIALPAHPFGAGTVFVPDDDAAERRVREALDAALATRRLRCAGWREVPTDPRACGPTAGPPRVHQVFVVPADDDAPDPLAFRRDLFVARRRAEAALRDLRGLRDRPDAYLLGLSADSLGYKAMLRPQALPDFYPDLLREDLAAQAAIFHQRFSTNTAPRWALAQPFRMLAHNGEINTIEGNRRWAQARRHVWKSALLDLSEFDPLVSMDGSDSQSLDEMLEVLTVGGLDPLAALRILIPPAGHSLAQLDPDLAAFYEYYALHTDPWDGPAGVVFCEGRYAGCVLDRNGLRPSRWSLDDAGLLVVASEAGVRDCPPERIVAQGRLGPGEMLAVDLQEGRLLDSAAIDAINIARAPFKKWLKAGVSYLHSDLLDPNLSAEPLAPEVLRVQQKRFGLSREEAEQVLRVLAETENEAVGSMGDDTPIAALSRQVRPLYDRFRQAFAQVTNPPIDPLREQVVMSLATQIGREGNIFDLSPDAARQVLLNSPVLSQRKLRQILAMPEVAGPHQRLALFQEAGEDLEAALRRLCANAEAAVRGGVSVLWLSDFEPESMRIPVHALLATGAVHRHLVEAGLRCACNLLVETATARDPHHIACLIGYGATAVYPWLAYQTLFDFKRAGVIRARSDGDTREERLEVGRSYRRGLRKGLLKILSKMGISTIGSYRGAQLFEILGLDRAVVDFCFAGTPSRIGGAGFARLEADQRELAAHAAEPQAPLAPGGLLKYMQGGEAHMYDPAVVRSLQRAVVSDAPEDWQAFVDAVDTRPPSTLRDLLEPVAAGAPIPLDEVEPVEAILARFDSAGMSLGALSPEAHEALAVAMNRLGCRSNSGEGGEDPARYGTERRSKIRQVASGRFGVTPAYLAGAEVLQIKIAQGAKPGEGGQLPGHKVDQTIARLRYAKPGIGLISPPPHHDIYSIEDLAQLIFDLKQVNPEALVSVKLVAHAGVGTIAAGVAKAYADLVTISGHDGGTGASPVSSIRYAGIPWELGLAEAQQTLRLNDLRGRVRLQTDGGLKTGLDVLKAALLGAESFGFGTAPMIALGCKYLRICHLNNCATGVATQDKRLREYHFVGLPERAMRYFRFVAEDVRRWMARLGIRRLEDVIGDVGRLRPRTDVATREPIDLSALLADVGAGPRTVAQPRNPPWDRGALNATLLERLGEAIEAGRSAEVALPIANQDRAVGARVSGAIAARWGDAGAEGATWTVRLTGAAGQSFGVWNAGGLHLHLDGVANDGVGKGMAGGRIVIRPPADAGYAARDAAIMGNACLYGATGGELYAAGRAGERFAVRNSGALAVIEGVGDHGCEYMTGGIVVVLGPTGLNFGAGFTGGFAYVYDADRGFVDRYNHELIDIHRISQQGMENHLQHLRGLIGRHVELTGSTLGAEILEDFRDHLGRFWLVKPKAASLESLIESLREAA